MHILKPPKILSLLALICRIHCSSLNAQCALTGIYYGNLDPTCPGTSVMGCLPAGSYISIVVISGNSYIISTCSTFWDTQLTLFDASGTSVLGYDDNGCSLQSTITYNATYTGYLNIQINEFPCIDDTLCTDITIDCIGSPLLPSPSGDCANAINVCTNLDFAIQASGYGYVAEIPPLGTIGNPEYYAYDSILSPWGSDHYGCLMAGELNVTWMIINIISAGNLEFSFGANGTQSGFYDWIMYPYFPFTCDSIPNGNFPPVRCNWNYAPYGGTGLASIIPPGGDSANYEPPLPVLAGQQYIVCMSNWSAVFTLVPLQFSGSSSVSCTPLSVNLIYFKAYKQKDGQNLLKWLTASETNNDHFIIQQSKDCLSWNTINQQPGAGNSTSYIHYETTHHSPQPIINYYRLIQVDYDGKMISSPIVVLDNTNDSRKVIKITNALGQQINQETPGFQLIYYSDGTIEKFFQQ